MNNINLSFARFYYFFSALIVVLACFGLFYLDRETHSVTDLFQTGNLVVLVFYFIPTYILSCLLYILFQYLKSTKSVLLSLLIGIPLGFSLMMLFFSYSLGRF
ncbi:MAG: hypothetical protein P1U44_10795 [Vicingaceae bacterium]|nr:hypothetical protein [Vicingaceae bacterium]